jgi:hypothetical protein
MTNQSGLVFIAVIALVAPIGERAASAQTADPAAPSSDVAATSVRPYVTVRFHAGPGINLMRDWREGIDTLENLAGARGLQPHDPCCLSKSWGATALVHVTERIAVGATIEALRDTRQFAVTDMLNAFGIHESAEYAFHNITEVEAKQVVVALYPRSTSHTHVQAGGGIASGHTTMSMPGSTSGARLHAPMVSVSAGTESRFWYVDAGWRFLRMRATDRTADDYAIGEARDLFASTAEVREFVRGRDTDLTGAWVRIGIALHFGRR